MKTTVWSSVQPVTSHLLLGEILGAVLNGLACVEKCVMDLLARVGCRGGLGGFVEGMGWPR